jgi:phage baseplate assembly protein W
MSFDLKVIGGDLAISNGDLATVENSEKLVQDVLKVVTTPIGSNPFFPWYGSPISKSLIGKAYDQNFVADIATTQLRASLETLQKMQLIQMRTDQMVTPQEQIAAIQDVLVRRDSIDPRNFLVTLTVLNKAFRSTQVSLKVTL